VILTENKIFSLKIHCRGWAAKRLNHAWIIESLLYKCTSVLPLSCSWSLYSKSVLLQDIQVCKFTIFRICGWSRGEIRCLQFLENCCTSAHLVHVTVIDFRMKEVEGDGGLIIGFRVGVTAPLPLHPLQDPYIDLHLLLSLSPCRWWLKYMLKHWERFIVDNSWKTELPIIQKVSETLHWEFINVQKLMENTLSVFVKLPAHVYLKPFCYVLSYTVFITLL
jgi:hypothetical protein